MLCLALVVAVAVVKVKTSLFFPGGGAIVAVAAACVVAGGDKDVGGSGGGGGADAVAPSASTVGAASSHVELVKKIRPSQQVHFLFLFVTTPTFGEWEVGSWPSPLWRSRGRLR